jgi:6-phosphogluconolactonase
MEVRRYADLDELSRAAADELAAIARAAVGARGRCAFALSGGSTPRHLFELLASAGLDALPWEHIDLWWGDERHVPPDHADSNYRMAREALIAPLGLGDSHVHRVAAELDAEAAARGYERELVGALGSPPIFDVVLLGIGPDGHTASLFPGTPALDEVARWVVANPVDSPVTHGKTIRITLTPVAINAARHVRFLVAGADKAEILAEILEGPREPARLPAQIVAGADVVWLVDAGAAAKLRGGQ